MKENSDPLLASPEFTEFLFNNLTSAIFLVDGGLKIQKINDTYKELFGTDESRSLNARCGNALGCVYAVDQKAQCGDTKECEICVLRDSLLKSFSDANGVVTCYVSRPFYVNGTLSLKHLQLKIHRVEYREKPMAIVAIHDITELEEQKKTILSLANKDYLTGLDNRRSFFNIAETLYQNAKRGNIPISISMFDIDFFKQVNDTWGHAAGDFILKAIAEILNANLRKADVIARFGGEEFCVLMHCNETDDAYTVIDKIRLLTEQHVFLYEGKKIDITISAGLTSVLEDNLEAMIKRADEMLYKAKKNGRNRTEEYTDSQPKLS
jgi:diguanylate cyclase (GGDEF)-like protein